MTGLVVANQVGTWLGYVTFGFIADAVGRRRTYVTYLLMAAVLVWAYASVDSTLALLALGPLTSFFATGHFSGFGAVTAELYPTDIRATAGSSPGRIVSAYARAWSVRSRSRIAIPRPCQSPPRLPARFGVLDLHSGDEGRRITS
jgi:MFS family permease